MAPETKTEVVLFSILAGVLGLAWYMHRGQGGNAGNADPLGDMLASLLGGSGGTAAPSTDSGSLPLISAATPYSSAPGAGGDITFNFGGAGAFTVDSPLTISNPVQSAPMGIPGIAGCNSCQGAASSVTQYGGPEYALGNMLAGQNIAMPAWN
jgi:hypothetical protein